LRTVKEKLIIDDDDADDDDDDDDDEWLITIFSLVIKVTAAV